MLPMTDIRSVTVEEEFEKNPDLRREDLDQLRGWLDTQKQLPEIKDEMLIMFHHSCYFDLARTKKCIDSYYTIRTIAPDFFTNRDLTIPQLKKSMEALHMAILPVPHPKGYHIFYHGLRDFEPAKYNHVDDYKLTYMSVDAWLLRNGTVPGLVLIMDMKGAKLGHLARVSLQAIRIGSRYVQEASPLRLKGIHVTNTVPWVDKAMAIIRPFTNKEIFDLVHFHKGDLETLYQHIPQECLPSDLGGTLPSLEILSDGDNMERCDYIHLESDEFDNTFDKIKVTSAAKDIRMPFVSAKCMAVADEYEKHTELIQEDLKDLRTWIEREQYLPEFKDEMLLHFYHSCYYDMENTKECIEAYHTIRINSPEIFNSRDISRPNFLEALNTTYLILLPVPDPSGNMLIYNGLRVTDPAKFNYIECNKCAFMAIDACLETYGPQPGNVLIIDMKGSKLAHLTKMSLSVMRKSLQYQQEANPIRLRAIHIINVMPWIDKLMALIKPFMKKELLSLLHLHADGLDSLYEHVPKECLPKELGGSQKSLEELHVESTTFLKSMQTYYAEEEKMRMSKSSEEKGKKKKKKNFKPENIMFEKLEID